MKTLFLKLTFLLIIQVAFGQESKYWVYLKAQEDTTLFQASTKNSSDVHITYYSHWLNAYAVKAANSAIEKFKELSYIQSIEAQGYFERLSYEEDTAMQLGFALDQIGAQQLLDKGLTGKGIKIGVIDGGFLAADKDESLLHLFKGKHIRAYRDYITPTMEAYKGSKALDDRHGTDVMQVLAGINEKKKIRMGLASDADYYLIRTDHGGSEKKIEEAYLIEALEWLDSLGVKLVNISLGYTEGFDNKAENYNPDDMNGRTAVAKAVDYAFKEEGMLVVVSAGNDGNKNWRILSTPADARHALSVGSTNYKHWDKALFSSIGPEHLPYLKPEISCFASQGTSFSAPVITSLAAAIWQYDSALTNEEVKTIINQSGHLYPYGNNHIGYGVPLANRMLDRLEGKILPEPEKIKVYENSYRFDEKAEKHAVVYHKWDQQRVKEELYIPLNQDRLKIKRPARVMFTTVIFDNEKVVELQWMRRED